MTLRKSLSVVLAIDLFESRAGSTPQRRALVFGAERLTYGDLDRRANQLVHWLVPGVTPSPLPDAYYSGTPARKVFPPLLRIHIPERR
jgi:non-ribosomal peptide synthetase component F